MAAGGLRAALQAAGLTGVEFLNAQPAETQPAVAQPTVTQPEKIRPNKPEPNKTEANKAQPEHYETEAGRSMLLEDFATDLANFHGLGEYAQEQVDPDFGRTAQPQASRKEIQAKHMPSSPGAPEPMRQSQVPTMQSNPLSLCAYPVDDDYWLFRLTPETPREDQEPGHRLGRERWHPYQRHHGA